MPISKPKGRFHMRGQPYVPKSSTIKPLMHGTQRLTQAFETNQAKITRRIARLIEAKRRIPTANIDQAKRKAALERMDAKIKSLGQEKGRLISKYEYLQEPLIKSAAERLKHHPDYPKVYSKTFFLEEMRDRIARPGTHTVGMLDIDKLNKFLAKHYHEPTGRVVSIFTESVAHVLKPVGGFACLYGGDEVAVFIPTRVEDTRAIVQGITVDFKQRLAKSEFAGIYHTPEVQNLAFSGIFKDFSWDMLPAGDRRLSMFLHTFSNLNPETIFHELSNGVIQMKKVEKKRGKVRLLDSGGRVIDRVLTAPPEKSRIKRAIAFARASYLKMK